MTDYKKEALNGMREVIKEIRPQAEENDDKEVLTILDNLESHLNKEEPMKAISEARKLKVKAGEKGYGVNI